MHHLPPARRFGYNWFRSTAIPSSSCCPAHEREENIPGLAPNASLAPETSVQFQREMRRGAEHENKTIPPACCILGWGDPSSPRSSCIEIPFPGSWVPLCCLGLMRRGRNSTAEAVFGIMEFWNGFGGKGTKAHPVPTPCHGQGHFPLEQVAPSLGIASSFKEVLRNKSP